jgi:S-formylglutathione hydrolase FrmB
MHTLASFRRIFRVWGRTDTARSGCGDQFRVPGWRAVRRAWFGLLTVGCAVLPSFVHAAAANPRIQPVEPRLWSCDFTSAAVGKPMRFLVLLPEGTDLSSPRQPVIYFLHGRGRHERTLLENPLCRARLMAARCAVVLPKGREGWYVNSPVVPEDRYADYVDEVMALAERHFPVAREARRRAIGGWSMGAYGAAYTAARRPGDFVALASIIGLLDFPRPPIVEPGQNYTVPARFGTDEAFWRTCNPRLLMPALEGVALFVAYADRAPERQMNEGFLADAASRGWSVEVKRQSGGHTFPMVEQALPAAFDFLEARLGLPSRNAQDAGPGSE